LTPRVSRSGEGRRQALIELAMAARSAAAGLSLCESAGGAQGKLLIDRRLRL